MSWLSSWGRKVALPEEEQPWTWPQSPPPPTAESTPPIEASSQYVSPGIGLWDGEQFFRGLGGYIDEISGLDYWQLRKRSAALFYSNIHAQGIVERFVTNVIHTGLEVECTPETIVLGLLDRKMVKAWTELVENRYRLYCNAKQIVDIKGRRTEGELQKQIYREALVEGDCLVVNRMDLATELPQLQIVPGNRVQTPLEKLMDPTVVDGVHLDSNGKHLGYWVYQGTAHVFSDKYVYVPAYGQNSGRRTAWMVYGPVKREDDVRGQPLLSVVMQGLKDLHDYRGYSVLKAKINALIVAQVENDQPTINRPITPHAPRRETATMSSKDTASPIDLHYAEPGIVLQNMAVGQKLNAYAVSGADVNYGPFATAIIAGMAWGLQCPPEILLLSFNSNYSASQAASEEWRMYLGSERERIANEHNQNLFEEWFISELLLGKFLAGQFLDARRDPSRYDEAQAWLATEWYGSVKPHIDGIKQVGKYNMMFAAGLMTHDRASRESSGMKHSKVVERLREENEALADMIVPFLELKQKYGEQAVNDTMSALGIGNFNALDTIEEEAAA